MVCPERLKRHYNAVDGAFYDAINPDRPQKRAS